MQISEDDEYFEADGDWELFFLLMPRKWIRVAFPLCGVAGGTGWAWSLPTLLRQWDLAGPGVLITFAASSLASALIWGMLWKSQPESKAATTVVRIGAGLIVASLLMMAALTPFLAFTLFSLASGAILVALGFLAERKRVASGALLAVGGLSFFVGALLGTSPVELLPVAILATSFGLATALVAGSMGTEAAT